MKPEIIISVGSIFDKENASDVLFVGSNSRGACDSPGAVLSQVMRVGGCDVTSSIRGGLQGVNNSPSDWSVGSKIFVHLPKTSQSNKLLFKDLLIGFHLTGDLKTLKRMFNSTFWGFLPYSQGVEGTSSITLPLMGTNVGGVSVVDWGNALKESLEKLYEEDTLGFKIIRIVARDDKTAAILEEIFV